MAITRGDRRAAVRASFESSDSNEVAFDPEFERQPGSEGPQIGPEYQAEIPELFITPADTFGSPKIKPRVGDKYQAQLPQLVPRAAADYNPDFLHGLPMPISPAMLTCQGGSRTSLVPGLDDQKWSEDVKKCFLLGLYVHERDFLRVRRFVETKRMGAILSQYYGKFYSTSEFLRWNYNRKIMSSKGVFCWRVFSGSRQQILLSRMLRKVSEECLRDLSEVSERFKGGRMSVVDYVASLKAIAGIDILVESVGLGEGEQDLTRVSPQPLTLEVKTKLLSGGFRIGKARSSDLFWNTVWPLLVARGWRPEVGKQFGRECLFFVMPGAKTYPRRKPEKGDKCFDSITDVLSRVRNESGLFSPGSDYDVRVGDGDQLYLQPIGGNNVVETTTVPVDTSLLDASAQQVRTLPLEENIDEELPSSSMPPTEDITLEYSSNASAQQVRSTSLEKNVDEELPSSSMPPTEDILLDSSNAREVQTIPEHSSFQERSTGDNPRLLIDLNLPYSESLDVVVVVEEQDDNTPQQSEDHRRSKAPGERRYSTRTRPPTSRLIEAAAHGYSLESRRRRRNEASSDDNQSTPSPRRPRVVAETASVLTTGSDNDNGNMPINPQVQFPPGPN